MTIIIYIYIYIYYGYVLYLHFKKDACRMQYLRFALSLERKFVLPMRM